MQEIVEEKTHREKAEESYKNLNNDLFVAAIFPSVCAFAVANRSQKNEDEFTALVKGIGAATIASPLCLFTAPVAALVYGVGQALKPVIMAGANGFDTLEKKENKQHTSSSPLSSTENSDYGNISHLGPPVKSKAEYMLNFAIKHSALVAGVVGALVCASVIITIASMGLGGVGIVAGAGAIAAIPLTGATAGLVSSGLTFFGLKVADRSNSEKLKHSGAEGPIQRF